MQKLQNYDNQIFNPKDIDPCSEFLDLIKFEFEKVPLKKIPLTDFERRLKKMGSEFLSIRQL